jgi:hypothetical protein
VGLVISFIPALHEVANFSWFIGVFLGGVTYRWLAREDREAATAPQFNSRVATQKSNPFTWPQTFCGLSQAGTLFAGTHDPATQTIRQEP